MTTFGFEEPRLRQDEYPSLKEYAERALREINAEDNATEIARVKKYTSAIAFYRGRQRGLWFEGASAGLTFLPFDISLAQSDSRLTSILLSNNIFRHFVKALVKEWVRSRARLRVNARYNSRRLKAAARFADTLVQQAQERIQNELFRQHEAKFAFLTGNYFRYSYIDVDVEAPTVRVPKLEQETIYRCTECSFQSKESFTNCPYCGAPTEQMAFNRIAGYNKYKIARPQTKVIDSRLVKLPLAARNLAECNYLRYWYAADIKDAEREFGIKVSAGNVVNNPILLYILATERDNGAADFSGVGWSPYAERVEVIKLWLRPDYYKHIKIAGKPLIDDYPSGVLFTFVRDELVRAEESSIEEHWSHGTYDALPESIYGDGLDDAIIDGQKINELRAMRMEAVVYGGFSKKFVNSRAVDLSLVNNDASYVPLNKTVDVGTDIRNVVLDTPPIQLSSELEAELTALERDMRAKTGAVPVVVGEADEELKTATGMSIVRDSALAILGIPLSIRAMVDVNWAYQILELEQKSFNPEYHLKHLGDYSRYEAEAFYQCDVRNDLQLTVDSQSWIPRSEAEIRADFERFLSLGLLNAQVPLQIKKKALEIYKIPMNLDTIQPAVRVAEQRLDMLLKMGEKLPKVDSYLYDFDTEPDDVEETHLDVALEIVKKIPFSKHDNHAVMVEVYKEALMSDELLYAHPIVIKAVELIIDKHQEAIAQEVAAAQASEALAQQPSQSVESTEIAQEANEQLAAAELGKMKDAASSKKPSSNETAPGEIPSPEIAPQAKPTPPEAAITGEGGDFIPKAQ
jgi:hypothetical protein